MITRRFAECPAEAEIWSKKGAVGESKSILISISISSVTHFLPQNLRNRGSREHTGYSYMLQTLNTPSNTDSTPTFGTCLRPYSM